MREFKPGDLVRIKDGTHQEGMPDHRVGIIIEKAPDMHPKSLGDSDPEDIMQILFLGHGRQILRFHVMFLEHFTTS